MIVSVSTCLLYSARGLAENEFACSVTYAKTVYVLVGRRCLLPVWWFDRFGNAPKK